ncbi:hypothetical protein HDZ31DRAFT_29860 [Schizophyllum fasciatum]
MKTNDDAASILEFKINHLFLPPKLPQHRDNSPMKERALIARVVKSGQEFLGTLRAVEDVQGRTLERWERVERMLHNFRRVCLGEGASMDACMLAELINNMQPGDFLPLFIGAQNAGVIIRKVAKQQLTYESFFASLPAANVTQTTGKVVAQFPTSSRLPLPADEDLVEALSGYLAEMHTLIFPDAVPETRKAGNSQKEYRDSTNPWYITDFITNVVRSFSGDEPDEALPKTEYVQKRLGDHVLWMSAELPWRRSPVLLVLKVALQTSLVGTPDQYGYKAFIAFALSRLLEEAARTETIADDVLYAMACKISLRVHKLRDLVTAVKFPFDGILGHNKAVARLLRQHWEEVQRIEALPINLAPPTEAEIDASRVLSMDSSRAYLDRVISRDEGFKQRLIAFDAADFEASLKKSERLNGCSPPQIFKSGDPLRDVMVAVHDVSEWLESSAPSLWMQTTRIDGRREIIGNLLACSIGVLSRFMRTGRDSDPETFSLAFLNVMDLWVIMDKTAVEAIPLLARYSPELTVEPLGALLLRRKSSMERLAAVEAYIRDRTRKAYRGSVYALDPDKCGNAFGAAYAHANRELRGLRERIEQAGERDKCAKQRELDALEKERQSLITRAAGLSCDYYTRYSHWGESYSAHSGSCTKCSLKNRAEHMTIEIYEAPLPGDTALADILVFELQVPPLFSLWRSTTLRLITMFTPRMEYPQRDRLHILDGYTLKQSSLFGDVAGTCDPKITLASAHKSFLISHYNPCHLPCSVSSVLKNHGPRWYMYDQSVGYYIPRDLPEMNLRDHCTPATLSHPYAPLHWTLPGTSHTPNQVIARQSDCPTSLSLHEWHAFGSLRSGQRLQWHNIALQLESPTLRLGEPAVHVLILQAALQAECASPEQTIPREAHAALADKDFGSQLLHILCRRRAACDENWEEGWVASTLSLAGHRLCELLPCSEPAIRAQAISFLRAELRPACMKWMRQLSAVIRRSASDDTGDLRNRLIQICVAARDTYRAHEGVFDSADALSDYLECCIVLYQYLPVRLAKLPDPLRILVQQDKYLSIILFSSVLSAISSSNGGIDSAVRRAWSGFSRSASSTWMQISGTHWVSCRTSESEGKQSKTVHFDILGGALYVDGISVQALPSEILQHSTYQEFFPTQYQMQVLPSTMAGMTYQCQYELEHNQIHFGKDGEDVVIRIQDQGGSVFEVVPRSALEGDIPNSVLEACVALMMVHRTDLDAPTWHRADAVLYFAPRNKDLGWDPLAEPAWMLRGVASSPSLISCTSSQQILCPRSGVVGRLLRAFSALEKISTNLIVEVSMPETMGRIPGASAIVGLPRYRLEFFFDEGGLLASKEFSNQVLASSRAIGSLYGVEKLVLRSRSGRPSQRVLIPAGQVQIQSRGFHPHIVVCPPPDPATHVDVYVLDVDTLLGQLKSDGNLDSSLMLAYLHALSSSHLQDPLTGERGVDRAIRILESASSFAFTHLSTSDIQLLSCISSLTPIRQYYPRHLTVMETITWNSALSPLSQSDLFARLVSQIVAFATCRSIFDPPSSQAALPLPEWDGDERLRVRSYNRTARLSPYAEDHWQRHGELRWAFLKCRKLTHEEFSWCSPTNPEGRSSEIQALAFRAHTWDLKIDVTARLWDHLIEWREFSLVSPSESITLSRPWLPSTTSQADIWFSLYMQCRTASTHTFRFSLMLTLSFVAYQRALDADLINSLLAIAVHAADNWSTITAADTLLRPVAFDLNDGWTLGTSELKALEHTIRESLVPFNQSTEYNRPAYAAETAREHKARCTRAYRAHSDEQVEALIAHLKQQWPCSTPSWPAHAATKYPLLDLQSLREVIDKRFQSMDNNFALRRHASALQSFLNGVPCQSPLSLRPPPSPPLSSRPSPLHRGPSILHLMCTRQAPFECTMSIRTASSGHASARQDQIHREQVGLVHDLADRIPSEGGFAEQYRQDLHNCADAMGARTGTDGRSHDLIAQKIEVPAILPDGIKDCLKPETAFEEALQTSGLWPDASVCQCLSYLSLPRRLELQSLHQWKHVLVIFAVSLIRIQREQRLDTLHGVDFDKELRTDVGQGYDTTSHPDWLLVQLDSNVTIRGVQAEVARRMLSPHNRVMQLNMGEGKSSVIIPLISTSSADMNDLTCVTVLKPLCAQMFHLLRQRVSGLANRRLYYLPFSRDTKINATSIRNIGRLFGDCASSGGILLCQPEHLLSFQLMASSMLCTHGMSADTKAMLDVQTWMSKRSRYILDERDEILSHRYQLIYTIGSPGPLEEHPERWLIIHQVMGLVGSNAESTMLAHPNDIEIERGCETSRQFRRMRILTDAACDHLIAACCADIVYRNAVPLLSFRSRSSDQVAAALQFICSMDTSFEIAKSLEDCFGSEAYPYLLLLRGLFAHGILRLALKEKRWRVDYGLDLRRSKLAIPYRAKDSPAPRAEFGHPDVILTLTSLAYYYGGLSSTELDTAFDYLLKTDNPALRYEDWTKGLDLPVNLRTIHGVNLKDANQRCNVIYPALRRVKAVIDFYLSECVFPKEARQFEHKLTTNPWDIARTKARPTTGFSGTNDNKYLLPTSIVQEDLSSQLHTNALVLYYILRPENRTIICADYDAAGIIREVVRCDPHVSVILDVGAQVLELDNQEMARQWLEQDTRATIEAVVYFGADDELYVRTRDGRVEQLRRSFYRHELGKTLVYLDEAHTRGTDLKLPEGTRALVTLGPKLTKDKLMQGCMRMRKLGRPGGHSVVFLASSEIQRRIRDCIREDKQCLDSSDALVWTMHETIRQTMENGALWANQGLNFDVRQAGWEAHEAGRLNNDGLAEVLLEREAHPLKELYGPHDSKATEGGRQTTRQRGILGRCDQYGFALSHGSQLLEEQERELAHEKEMEREVQRPPPADPKAHSVQPELKALVRTGASTFVRFRTLHDCLVVTSVYQKVRAASNALFQGRRILATVDFEETIHFSPNARHEKDGFIWPVQWIVSTKQSPDVLLLVSPFEANDIIADVRQSADVRLHLYSPRVSRTMRAFDDLTFLITPSSAATTSVPPESAMIHELNLFAGSLFLGNEAAYRELCQLLGLHLGEVPEALKGKIGTDGFVRESSVRASLGIVASVFKESPSLVLRALIDLRRKGQGFLLTHIGQMLYGNEVTSEDF